jgi:serine/threonine-protein kinase RsbW
MTFRAELRVHGGATPDPASFWQRDRVRSFLAFRDELRPFFERLGIPADVSGNLVLVTQEACNNACRHSGRGAGCDVSVVCLEGSVTIEVSDGGDGFDFDAVKATWPPALSRGGGRGLFLMATLTDSLEVLQRHPGTLIRMLKVLE